MLWRLRVSWSWGRTRRFDEEDSFTYSHNASEDTIKLDIVGLWRKIQDRYQYDCGDKSMPLNPVILSAKLTLEDDPKDVSYLIPQAILADHIEKNCASKKPEKIFVSEYLDLSAAETKTLQAGSYGLEGKTPS